MKRCVAFLFLALLAVAEPCGAGTYTQDNKRGASLEVRYDGETRRITLSDLIMVTLTIEGSPGLKTPTAPLDLPAAAPWVLVERSRFEREIVGQDRIRYRLTYRFAPREPGKKVVFQFPDVKYSDGAKAEQIAAWLPVSFEVESQITQPDLAALRDITAVEEMPPLRPIDRSWQLWVGLAGAALILFAAAIGIRAWLRGRAARSATQFALHEWRRLMTMNLPAKGRSERFITLLTTLVRRYLERQFALPARRQTTPEFLAHLDQVVSLSVEEKRFLTNFLLRCEAVKFGQQAMPAAECQHWADAVRQFLQQRLVAAPADGADVASA